MIVSAQDPVLLRPDSEPQPDLMLLKPRADFYSASHPEPADVLLIVEVSDTSLRKDLDIKVPLYAKHGTVAPRLLPECGVDLSGLF